MNPPVEGVPSEPEPAEGTGRDAVASGGTGSAESRFGEFGDGSRGSQLPVVLLAVFVAGALGTAARLLLDAAIPAEPSGLPVSTLLINTAGSFALGLVVAAVPPSAHEWLRAGVTAGLLGSFTTFSALTVAAAALTGTGDVVPAVVLLVSSVVAGAAAAAAGMALGAKQRSGRG